jgi:hypothetical protein
MAPTSYKTWKPVIAGILCIVAGSMRLLATIIIVIISGVTGGLINIIWPDPPQMVSAILGFIGLFTIPFLAISVIAIIGGIYALIRKSWAMAIIGCCCAVIVFWIMGIPALILIALSGDEFARKT